MNIKKLHGQSALVIGLGISGRSAASFLLAKGANVLGVDRNLTLMEENPEVLALKQKGLKTALDDSLKVLNGIDLIVLSPGVSQVHPLVAQGLKQGIEVLGEIELGCRCAKNPMVGITGTNGKTTVTLLVAHVLNQNGCPARALGNVGIPFTEELLNIDPDEIVVLELSSYQLETMKQPILSAGVLLNITPDHLDRYVTLEAYAKAKCLMEVCLQKGGVLYVEEKTFQEFGELFHQTHPIKTYGYSNNNNIYSDLVSVYKDGKKAFDLNEQLKHKHSHNLENLLAAFAICSTFGLSGEQFLKGLATFNKPPHRIEYVLTEHGVSYYDDSKGTNIDAVIRAVDSLDGSIVLIAGGVDKGAPYTPWIKAFDQKVKAICAIGQAAKKIECQLGLSIPVYIFESMNAAVFQASQLAQSGDNVLLSPGCASFDMFKDYAHRGDEFKKSVHALTHSFKEES